MTDLPDRFVAHNARDAAKAREVAAIEGAKRGVEFETLESWAVPPGRVYVVDVGALLGGLGETDRLARERRHGRIVGLG